MNDFTGYVLVIDHEDRIRVNESTSRDYEGNRHRPGGSFSLQLIMITRTFFTSKDNNIIQHDHDAYNNNNDEDERAHDKTRD